ncbi:hypothetical protein [Phaeodactylibacter xiamenensis]|uniref:hypothetical protein n=1 Tax=Phaeodactylibacter xiamenensis TaxID=1524460 RepID=UPI003BAD514B
MSRSSRFFAAQSAKRCNAGDQAASSELGLPGRGLGASSAGRLVSECRSLGLPGGGRKATVALGDAAWCLSVRRSFSGDGNLNLNLNLGGACPGPPWTSVGLARSL